MLRNKKTRSNLKNKNTPLNPLSLALHCDTQRGLLNKFNIDSAK